MEKHCHLENANGLKLTIRMAWQSELLDPSVRADIQSMVRCSGVTNFHTSGWNDQQHQQPLATWPKGFSCLS